MVKKALLIILFAVVFAPQTALAQTISTTTTPSAADYGQGLKTQRTATAQVMKDAMQVKRDEFKAKIAGIKDARKQLIVEGLDTRIATSNAKLTNKMTNALTRLTEIIAKLKIRTSVLQGEGKDVTALNSAITAAETAITDAMTAVEAQKAKVYTANITTDATLGSVIGGMVRQFKNDIQGVFLKVKNAHQKVKDAWVSAAKLSGEKTATSSAAVGL